MIGLTRTDGEHCRLDPAMVQRVEGHPTTIVHLTDGAKYAVLESVDEVIRVVRDHSAAVAASPFRLLAGTAGGAVARPGGPPTGRRRSPVAPVHGEA